MAVKFDLSFHIVQILSLIVAINWWRKKKSEATKRLLILNLDVKKMVPTANVPPLVSFLGSH